MINEKPQICDDCLLYDTYFDYEYGEWLPYCKLKVKCLDETEENLACDKFKKCKAKRIIL